MEAPLCWFCSAAVVNVVNVVNDENDVNVVNVVNAHASLLPFPLPLLPRQPQPARDPQGLNGLREYPTPPEV